MKQKDFNLAFVDTETTGLSPKEHEIIEIAAIIYDPKEDKILKEWSRKAAPRHIKTASTYALEINGYKKEPETYVDGIKEVILEFYEIVKGHKIIGQNIQFDVSFIEKYYKEFSIGEEFHRHSKLELSSIAWPILSKTDLESLSLKSQCNYFNISNKNEHRALTDCHRTLEVYKCLTKIYDDSMNHICSSS
jgi:DNA polymerase-3 subunit epsilon